MDFQVLANLIRTNPSWESLSDDDLAAWCNEKTVQQVANLLNSNEMYELIDGGEFTALSAEKQNEVWNILLLFSATGIPTSSGSRARTRLIAIFGGTSTTINNVVAAITFYVTRAFAAGVGQETVNAGEVQYARDNP